MLREATATSSCFCRITDSTIIPNVIHTSCESKWKEQIAHVFFMDSLCCVRSLFRFAFHAYCTCESAGGVTVFVISCAPGRECVLCTVDYLKNRLVEFICIYLFKFETETKQKLKKWWCCCRSNCRMNADAEVATSKQALRRIRQKRRGPQEQDDTKFLTFSSLLHLHPWRTIINAEKSYQRCRGHGQTQRKNMHVRMMRFNSHGGLSTVSNDASLSGADFDK